jgi:hypothetical protein
MYSGSISEVGHLGNLKGANREVVQGAGWAVLSQEWGEMEVY